MARITVSEERLLTIEEAWKFCRNVDGKVRFYISFDFARPVVNDGDADGTSYFPEHASINVSRQAAIDFIKDRSKALEARGGRIRIGTRAPEPGYRNSYVWIG